MKNILKRLLSFSSGYKKEFIIAMIAMIVTAGATAATSYLVKPVLDEIFIKKDIMMLSWLPWVIVIVYGLKSAGRYFQSFYMRYIGEDIVRRLRNELLNKIISLDISFFHSQRTGELISRLTNDVTRVQGVVSSMIPEVIRETLTILGLLGVVIYQSPHLAFYALVVLPLCIYPLSRLAKRMRRISKDSQEKNADLTSRLSEIFHNIETTKVHNAEQYEYERFQQESYAFFKLNMKAVRVGELVSPVMEILGSLAIALVIFVGGMEVIQGRMSVGSFFSFMTALFMLYTPIKRISGIYNSMQDAVSAGERIFTFMDLKPKIFGGEQKDTLFHTLTWNNVMLQYGDKVALRGINLDVKSGESIALVGDSGGGKTSLMSLLVRFYDPTQGEILLDGKNIQEYDLQYLRHNIAFVSQKVAIFNDTVAANVAYGLTVDLARVEESLQKAYALEFVHQLPQGINTLLSESGSNLSGGQRQRIAIARAFYKEAKIIIFDEATSALDNASEQEVTKAYEELASDKIAFVIAHRLSTVKNAQKIVVLKKGKIEGVGTWDELLQHNLEFQKLVQKSFPS